MSALTDTELHWLHNDRLYLCSPSACCLWMRLLPLMYTSERPGFLQVNGSPMSAAYLGIKTGYVPDEVSRCLAELSASGIACATDAGPVYCKVLVAAMREEERHFREEEQMAAEEARETARQEEQRRLSFSVRGKKGAEVRAARRLALSQAQAKLKLSSSLAEAQLTVSLERPEIPTLSGADPPDTRIFEQPPPLYLSSLSSLPEEEKKMQYPQKGWGPGEERIKRDTMPPLPESLDTPEFRQAWERWLRHRREIGSPLKRTAAESNLRTFEKWGVARAIAAIDNTIFKGWVGLGEPERLPLFVRSNSNVPTSKYTEARFRREHRSDTQPGIGDGGGEAISGRDVGSDQHGSGPQGNSESH